MSGKFQCAMCAGIFESSNTEEEKREEAKKLFGQDIFEREPDMPSVCHDCWLGLGFCEQGMQS